MKAEARHGAVGEEFWVLGILLDGFAVEHFGGLVVAILEVSVDVCQPCICSWLTGRFRVLVAFLL